MRTMKRLILVLTLLMISLCAAEISLSVSGTDILNVNIKNDSDAVMNDIVIQKAGTTIGSIKFIDPGSERTVKLRISITDDETSSGEIYVTTAYMQNTDKITIGRYVSLKAVDAFDGVRVYVLLPDVPIRDGNNVEVTYLIVNSSKQALTDVKIVSSSGFESDLLYLPPESEVRVINSERLELPYTLSANAVCGGKNIAESAEVSGTQLMEDVLISAKADKEDVQSGESVTVNFSITNNGNTAYTGIRLSGKLFGDISGMPNRLEPGESFSVSAVTDALYGDETVNVSFSGCAGDGQVYSVSSEALSVKVSGESTNSIIPNELITHTSGESEMWIQAVLGLLEIPRFEEYACCACGVLFVVFAVLTIVKRRKR